MVHPLLLDFGITTSTPMQFYCYNQAAIFIANNLVFDERTKHIEIDCHFIRDLSMRKQISTPFVCSENQLGDILKYAFSSFFFSTDVLLARHVSCLTSMLHLERKS